MSVATKTNHHTLLYLRFYNYHSGSRPSFPDEAKLREGKVLVPRHTAGKQQACRTLGILSPSQFEGGKASHRERRLSEPDVKGHLSALPAGCHPQALRQQWVCKLRV